MEVQRRMEVLDELGLGFLGKLKRGDKIEVLADNREKSDIVVFERFTDIYLVFTMDGKEHGIFFQEIREGKCKVMEVKTHDGVQNMDKGTN